MTFQIKSQVSGLRSQVSGHRSAMTHISVLVFFLLEQVGARPNFVLILADDLGVNDVSWNNPSVTETPTLESLARAGQILDSAYTLPVCSPSRAALLTGIFPFKYGFQVLLTLTSLQLLIIILLIERIWEKYSRGNPFKYKAPSRVSQISWILDTCLREVASRLLL